MPERSRNGFTSIIGSTDDHVIGKMVNNMCNKVVDLRNRKETGDSSFKFRTVIKL